MTGHFLTLRLVVLHNVEADIRCRGGYYPPETETMTQQRADNIRPYKFPLKNKRGY